MKHALMTSSKWSDFPSRVITGLVGAPLVIAAVVFGSPFFDVMIFALLFVVITELHHILRPTHRAGLPFMVSAAGVLVLFVAYWQHVLYLCPLLLAVMVTLSAAVSLLEGHRPTETWGHNTLYPVFGVFYAGVPLSLLLLIRSGANGLLWMMVLTWIIWSTDTMALVGGRLFGRRKLAPRISPSKTVEGALTGLVFGIGMGTSILILAGQPIVVGVSLSMAASAMAIVGDLFESLLKRVFDVKDSSHLLPGHGGMMDRLDGFFGAVPVFYLLLLAYGLL